MSRIKRHVNCRPLQKTLSPPVNRHSNTRIPARSIKRRRVKHRKFATAAQPLIRSLLLTTSTFLMNVVLLFFLIAWYLLHVLLVIRQPPPLWSPRKFSNLLCNSPPSTHTLAYILYHTYTHAHRPYTIPAPRMRFNRVKHGKHTSAAQSWIYTQECMATGLKYNASKYSNTCLPAV